jgi:hypothetical protein
MVMKELCVREPPLQEKEREMDGRQTIVTIFFGMAGWLEHW